MIFNPFRKNTATDAVYAVYRAIVAQSRQSRFYAEWNVPDTVTGRFDMICLHLALLFRRLRAERREVAEFSQAVFDLFFKDMDRSLREMGAGDMGVPKKIQKMGNIFYGLLDKLSEALNANDPEAVEAVLVRNIYNAEPNPSAPALARYLMATAEQMASQPVDAIIAGEIAFGRPS